MSGGVGAGCQHADMGHGQQPFVGSEALAAGEISRHELRKYYRSIVPNVYLDKRVQPSLRQRTVACLALVSSGGSDSRRRGISDAWRQVGR